MIFNRFFKPYAEYCLRTTLSEDELKNALEKEFPWYGFLSGFKTAMALASLEDKAKVVFFKTCRPLTLHPVRFGRNSLRGDVHIKCRKAEPGKETVLDITIVPQDTGLLVWIIFVFAVAMTILFLCAGTWKAVAPLILIGFQFVILAMCRSIGESEVPEIQRAFETTLRQLEKKYKDNNQGRGDHE